MGQARELPGRLHVGRLPGPVLVQVQLQALVGRQVMIRRTFIALSAIASRDRGVGLGGLAEAAKPSRSRRRSRPRCRASPRPTSTPRLQAAYDKYKDLKEGKNADYIPALAKVDSKIFGIALVTADGKVYTAGDVKSEVSIQSISKVFTMAKVMEESGPGRDREADRRRRDRHALQLDRRGRVRAEGARRPGDERARQPRRDHRHQHGEGRHPRRGLEEHPRLPLRLRGPAARRRPGGLQVRGRHEPAQPGDRLPDVRLRVHQDGPGAGDRRLHGAVRDRASTRRTSRRWPARSRTAARTRSPASR